MTGKEKRFILWFDEVGIKDVPLVGGKNASLGEMISSLSKEGVKVPNGFAVTAYAYRYLLEKAGIEDEIKQILSDLDTHDMHNLKERGKKVRGLIRDSEFPPELDEAIRKAYAEMPKRLGYEEGPDVAVRSSATAEDLPDASFAGQQETYLNIKGPDALIEACKKCFASLFTNRAISYRVDKGFNHFDVYLSIAVQKMVRSDSASSGVMFSIDTESGFKDAAFITSSYGLGENVVKGAVNPDDFYVFKPTLKDGKRPIIGKKLGAKKIKMIYAEEGTENIDVLEDERNRFSITDDEILKLAEWACIIEDHYDKPMDMEWAKDGDGEKVGTGELFMVQARPETVHSQKDISMAKTYELKETGKVLVEGQAVGAKIGQGEVNNIKSTEQIHEFKKGQVLVTDMTDPDWEPIMKIASAIVTNRGGRTCFVGDTRVLTDVGFLRFEEVYERVGDGAELYVPSLNRETLKMEWKKILCSMKRKAPAIEVSVSQTGRVEENTLRLTPEHKMLTFNERNLIEKEISSIIEDKNMLLVSSRIPSLMKSTEKEKELAYLMGAMDTDGSVGIYNRKGQITFTQKNTPEKGAFIDEVRKDFSNIFGKELRPREKLPYTGIIRGSPISGTATDYRCFSKEIAMQMLEIRAGFMEQLLCMDEECIAMYLAGVIDGDGSYSPKSNRLHIYCGKEGLLQNVVVGCLMLGILPQVTRNRTCYNVQIVDKVDYLLRFTKRVKGDYNRKTQGTRFLAARQVLEDIADEVNWKGRIKPYVKKNLLLDAKKIEERVLPLTEGKVRGDLSRILNSGLGMQRVGFNQKLGTREVYNIEVEDNHNYIVFTERYTPVLVNNCHAAIVSRELGIPCVIGTENGAGVLKTGDKVTVSCADGEVGKVYEGLLEFEVHEMNLKKLPKTRTKIMMNVGLPERAFIDGQIPNDGVGLAREEFIINSYIGIHPLALIHYEELKKKKDKKIAKAIKTIDERTRGYKDKTVFFIDQLAQGIAKIAAGFYPNDVIVRLSDFKSNEYVNLIGGFLYEPEESNPMIGWRGASRYYDKDFKPAFGLECKAIIKAREEFGLTNIKVMVPFCRTVEEGKKVIEVMKEFGLTRGENGLEVYVMCEIPSNVILADQFAEIFDGFSIGSNDLTQLALGLDRDSELVAHIYDERNDAIKRLVKDVIDTAKSKGKKIGICGQAPSDYDDFATFLVECGIDSMSLTPDTVIKTKLKIAQKEKELGISPE